MIKQGKTDSLLTAVESTDAGAGNRFTAAVDSTAAGLNELRPVMKEAIDQQSETILVKWLLMQSLFRNVGGVLA